MEKKERFSKRELAATFRATLPIFTGYLALGFGFGVLLRAKGYGVLWALGMSVSMYAGVMQYVAVGLLAGQVPLVTVALTTLIVNARHIFYGLSLLDKYPRKGLRRIYMMHALTDETYSLVCTPPPKEIEHPQTYYFLVSLFDHLYWISGCVIGAAVGAVLPFNTQGIDFVLTALFITIFIEQWLSTGDHTFALLGVGVTLICRIVLGSENFLIPSMILITAGLWVLRKVRREVTDDA